MQTYLIHAPILRKVKIGRSSNAMSRFRCIQGSSPEILTLLRVIPGDHESRLHKRFAAYHSHLEWFNECEEIMEYAKSGKLAPKAFASNWVPLAVKQDWLRHWAGEAIPDIDCGQMLKVPDAAKLLAIDHREMRRAIDANQIKVIRLGRAIRISPKEVRRLITEAATGGVVDASR